MGLHLCSGKDENARLNILCRQWKHFLLCTVLLSNNTLITLAHLKIEQAVFSVSKEVTCMLIQVKVSGCKST